MKLSKEKFVKAINELKEADRIASEVNKIFDESTLNLDFCNAQEMSVYHADLVVDLLDTMFDDDLISIWCFEWNYGKKFKKGFYQINGVDIDLSTAEKLYDHLIGISL